MKQSRDLAVENASSGSSHQTAITDSYQRTSFSRAVTVFFQTLRAVLREIFDESAYNRFLERTKAKRSVASYRDFMHERQDSITQKPRCC